jgi:hypothetical protein
MRLASGVITLLAAFLCAYSGACNVIQGAGFATGAGALKLAKGGGPTPTADFTDEQKKALEKVETEFGGETVQKATEAGISSLLVGALSLLGGLLAFVAGILVIVDKSRAFSVVAIVIAIAGAAGGLIVPFTSTAFTMTKVILLLFGLLGAFGSPAAPSRSQPPGAGA